MRRRHPASLDRYTRHKGQQTRIARYMRVFLSVPERSYATFVTFTATAVSALRRQARVYGNCWPCTDSRTSVARLRPNSHVLESRAAGAHAGGPAKVWMVPL